MRKRYSFIIPLLHLVLCSAAFAQRPIRLERQDPPVWLPIFQGIEMAKGIHGTGKSLQTCVAVRIDLKNTGIKFLATPSNGPAPKETNSERASDFLKKHPRTAAGFSKDARYLIFVLIDGRRPFHSMGANLHDTALWLARFGAWDGCNLDGGGSSTLVIDNGRGGYRLLNYPSSGRERAVGNLLGIFATPLGGIKAKAVGPKK